MCGIIHVKKTNRSESAKKLVLKRFDKQKSRGTQGFGYVEIKNGVVIAETRTQTETEIRKKLEKSTADEILFHHRYPTSTPNIVESTHPIKVSHESLQYDYYVVHNGMISNDDTLRDAHILQGFEYTTDIKKQWIAKGNVYETMLWNDSESVSIDIAQAIETGKDMTSKGSIAIIALQYDKKTQKAIALYYGHNSGNPLKVENDKNFFALSSETGKDTKIDTLYRYDYKTNVISSEPKKIGDYYTTSYSYDYGDYGDYNKGITTYDKETKKYTKEYDENDFELDDVMDDYQEIIDLQEEIKNAKDSGDEELAGQLEQDLETFIDEMDEKRRREIYGTSKRYY